MVRASSLSLVKRLVVFAKHVQLGIGVKRLDDLLLLFSLAASWELAQVVSLLEVDVRWDEVHLADSLAHFILVAHFKDVLWRVARRALERGI